MHPTLARYLDPAAAVKTLARDERGEPLSDDEERAYAAAAKAHPDLREALREALKGARSGPSPEGQRAILWLAAYAAVESMRKDAVLGPLLEAALQALTAEGATPAEAEELLASLVLEEGFTGDEDPDLFDQAFVKESLEGFPALAKLSPEGAEALQKGFVAGAAADWRRAHELAARSLLEAAWSEGMLPINPEHMAEAVDAVQTRLGDAQAAQGLEALRRFVEHLASAGLVGPKRKARLLDVVELAEQEAGRGPAH